MKNAIAALAAASLASAAPAQDYSRWSDDAARAELARRDEVQTIVMVPMRDGVRLATNIYRPKDATGPLPTILWKTPYNELSDQASTAKRALAATSRGYAFVVQNERGRYFSEGEFEILGKPATDGYDALSWIASQPWSNGKVGTLGCSSSAEWQLQLAAENHPAHAAMVPMAAGAGIGQVGEFQEQGNLYTGGVPRTLFTVWLYGVDNPARAQLPQALDDATRSRVARYNDLDAKKPDVNWVRQIKHLPVSETLSSLGEPRATFEEFVTRTPADPGWRTGGLYHDSMGWGVPALWFNSWYDVSIGPNMALFNHARAGRERQGGKRQPVRRGGAEQPLPIRPPFPRLHLGRPEAGRRQLRHGRPGLRFLRPLAEGRREGLPERHSARPLLQHGHQRVALGRAVAAEGCEDGADVPALRRPGEQPLR